MISKPEKVRAPGQRWGQGRCSLLCGEGSFGSYTHRASHAEGRYLPLRLSGLGLHVVTPAHKHRSKEVVGHLPS